MTEQQASVLEKAITAWEQLTGTKLMGRKQNLLTFKPTEEIKEAFKLDESGVTALLILNAETEAYAAEVSYSVKELVDAEEEVLSRVQAFSAIRKTLKSPEFASILQSFRASLTKALEFYGCLTPEVKKVLKDNNELAYIRRDALRAYGMLREDVFARGNPCNTPIRYNPGVWLFWNVNSLVRIVGNSHDGVSLVVVQDSVEDNASHFGFCIKNGSNLVVLSDRPKFDNPEQAVLQSARGGSRELARLVELFRFPYDLLGVWYDPKGRAHVDIPGSQTLFPAQKEAVKVSEFSQLPAPSIIWLTMMFELIGTRYWKELERIKNKPLSYTGTMIEQPRALQEGCQALELQDYKPLKFEAFKREDVLTDKVKFEVKQTRQNEWMETRYKAQVPEELLNPLPSHRPQIPEHLQPAEDDPDQRGRFSLDKLPRIEPLRLREDSWGTEKELAHSHMWVARKNFAVTVGRLALAEFKQEHEKVLDWYKQRVIANREYWLKGLAEGKLLLPVCCHNTDHFAVEQRPVERVQANRLAYYPHGEERYHVTLQQGLYFHNGYERRQDAFYCYLNPKNIGHEVAIISPNCPEALAALAGCKVEEMPVFLQHWFSDEIYHGNSILTDVDPLETIHNPWIQEFHPKLMIRFGRKGLYELQKRHGIPKHLPWKTKEQK